MPIATTRALTATRTTAVGIVGIVGFAIALALASQVAIPIPGTPVPITLQPMVVALAGLWLGPIAGATSMVLYIVAGAAGLPVFSPFGAPGLLRLVGPTAGYIYAYPVAAFVAGTLARRATTFTGRAGAAIASSVVLLIGGLSWLAIINGSVARALALGITPFVPLDALKAIVAALLAPRRSGGPTRASN